MKPGDSGFAGRQQRLTQLVSRKKTTEAIRLARSSASEFRHDPAALYALARTFAQLGRIDDVVSCCRQVTKLLPGHAGAHYNLAVGLQQQGQLNEALASATACLAAEPGYVPALTLTAGILAGLGDHAAAVLNLQKAATLATPQSPDIYFSLGVQLQACARLPEAAGAYQQAILLKPGFFEAINNLGHIYTELGEVSKAIPLFQTLLEIKPSSPEAHNNIGIAYDSLGKASEAEAAYRQALELRPDLTDTRCHLGFLLAGEGRTNEAVECFEENLRQHPEHETSIAGKADALEKAGRIDEAYSTVMAANAQNTGNADLMLAYCTVMLRKGETSSAITQAERLLSQDNLQQKGISDLSFVLGNLYEKNRDYATAFRYFEQANRHSPCTYKHASQVNYIDRIIAATSRTAMEALPRSGHAWNQPVFIVGMPRSGTSLVEQILASHPDVFGGGELRYISDIAASFSPPLAQGKNYPDALAELDTGDVETLASRYIDPVSALTDGSRIITDKMPHNFLYLALINCLFPAARIVHISRSPLDNCLSLYFHGFNAMHSYTTNLAMLGQYYREYQRLMSHWRQVIDIPVLNIRYEDIVDKQEESTRTLLDFCGLEWSDRCMDFHSSNRFVKTPSYDQVRQPIYKRSVERWRNYQEFIAPLVQALGQDGELEH